MSDTIRNINLVIADRPYRLKISAAEEETVRKAAKMVKNKLTELGKMYQAKDKQDYLAMAALMFCVETLTKKADEPSVLNIENQLDEVDELLTRFLDNN